MAAEVSAKTRLDELKSDRKLSQSLAKAPLLNNAAAKHQRNDVPEIRLWRLSYSCSKLIRRVVFPDGGRKITEQRML